LGAPDALARRRGRNVELCSSRQVRFSAIALSCTLALGACSRVGARAPSVVVPNSTYAAGSLLSVRFDNGSKFDLELTGGHTVERLENGQWVDVWPSSSADAWLAPGQHLVRDMGTVVVPACRVRTLSVRLPEQLPAGRYRLRWGKWVSNAFSVAATARGR